MTIRFRNMPLREYWICTFGIPSAIMTGDLGSPCDGSLRASDKDKFPVLRKKVAMFRPLLLNRESPSLSRNCLCHGIVFL